MLSPTRSAAHRARDLCRARSCWRTRATRCSCASSPRQGASAGARRRWLLLGGGSGHTQSCCAGHRDAARGPRQRANARGGDSRAAAAAAGAVAAAAAGPLRMQPLRAQRRCSSTCGTSGSSHTHTRCMRDLSAPPPPSVENVRASVRATAGAARGSRAPLGRARAAAAIVGRRRWCVFETWGRVRSDAHDLREHAGSA